MTPEEILDKHNRKWQPEHNARYVRFEAALAAMYEYARTEQNSHKHNIVRPESASASDGELLQGEEVEKGVSVDFYCADWNRCGAICIEQMEL